MILLTGWTAIILSQKDLITKRTCITLNHLHPNISMYILQTVSTYFLWCRQGEPVLQSRVSLLVIISFILGTLTVDSRLIL